ncbi:phosphoribosylformylglycinamidine synthase subunit PurL [Candidatus Micrarchaeota archaeon]|nr:phosphoribosylformylglycinamidine synthase subunit PurL [Candidatus Micrarchaeota archaeon]
MEQRLEIAIKNGLKDVQGDQLAQRIAAAFGIKANCKFIDVYNFSDRLSDEEMEILAKEVFCDLVVHDYSFREPLFGEQWRLEIGMLPGVTDNVGKTATEAIKDRLGKDVQVYYSRIFVIRPNNPNPGSNNFVDEFLCERIATMVSNPLVEKHNVYAPGSEVQPYLPIVHIPKTPNVETFSLNASDARLATLAKERLLALSLDEMKEIKYYLRKDTVLAERKKFGLDNHITDVELEALAQTWSEHCKHKIFNALIKYDEDGELHPINSLFKTFIKGATDQIKKPYVISVFKDNGGIIKFNPEFDIAIKVETHNAPSALDPYGGALTGVLGVQRDVLGTGMGANPIANIDVLCFGRADTPQKEVPKGVIHPKAISDGVVLGVEHGGNKMGIPTINGSIVYENGFVARPLVYCGTIGILPSTIKHHRTSEKHIEPGYLAVMVGGRIGKDGIHGATFSSMQIDAHVPQSVVQIGDPITQKKMLDFIIAARDELLYEAITDNGAGGLSSSIGELAQLSGGCEIYLDKCPLKYPGLDPWEILVSESQERMTIAVKESSLARLKEIAATFAVEVSVVGKFTKNKKFHALYNNTTVAYLDMKFLHEGVPQLKLKASWKKLTYPEPKIPEFDPLDILHQLLSSPNITTKERVIRRYDHEVKGMSVIKPIMFGPSDAGVIRPVSDSQEGLVLAHGICPRYVQDGYAMASLAFDEAVRNAICVGAKFGYLACLDNFSWPDPIKSDKTPDGEQKLGSLVRACIAFYDCATSYGIPIISGKDSMKNDYYTGDKKYSIPPTLLVTVIGKMDNVSKAVSSEFKTSGSYIYVLGKTRDELGGSEFYKLFNGVGNRPPQIYPDEHIPLYKGLCHAIEDGLVESAHDISDGGLAVAFAECVIGLGLGAELDLGQIKAETKKEDSLLFSESSGRFIVSVSANKIDHFEKVMHGTIFARAGRVRGDRRFIIKSADQIIVNDEVERLKESFNKGI